MLNTAAKAPRSCEASREITTACIEISTAARTLGKLADQAIDELDNEGQDFAWSVNLLAGEIGRRMDMINEFLDMDSNASALPGNAGCAKEEAASL